MITGANGTIGADLVHQFSKTNKVFAFYRTYNKVIRNLNNKNIKWIKMDLKNPIKLKLKPDLIIHSVVAHPFSKKNRFQDYIDSNIIALKNVIEFSSKKKVNKFIYLSSFKIYGSIKTKYHIQNNLFINPDILGATKILSEKIVEQQSFDFINIRLPGVISYNIKDPRRPWLNNIITNLKLNKRIEVFNKNLKFNNIIDTNEIFRFINHLLKNNFLKKRATVDLTTSEPIQIKKIINFIKQRLKSKSLIKYNRKKIHHYTISIKEVKNRFKFEPINTLKLLDRYLKK